MSSLLMLRILMQRGQNLTIDKNQNLIRHHWKKLCLTGHYQNLTAWTRLNLTAWTRLNLTCQDLLKTDQNFPGLLRTLLSKKLTGQEHHLTFQFQNLIRQNQNITV